MVLWLAAYAAAAAALVSAGYWLARWRERRAALARVLEIERSRKQLEGGLKAVQEVTDVISSHPDQPDMLGAIVAIVAKSLEADVCAFLLFDETSGELVTQAGAYGVSEEERSLYRIAASSEESSSARVFRTGTPFITGHAQDDPQVIAHFARLWKCNSLMVVPLRIADRRIGVLRIGSRKSNFFNEGHLRFTSVIAEEAAVLVESAMLTKRLTEMSLEMARLNGMKDEFLSMVSHEFKTPLTSIRGFLTVLLEEDAGPLNEDQKRFLRISQAATERLGALVSDLLDVSRLEHGLRLTLGPVSLAELATLSVEGHYLEAKKRNIHLHCRIQKNLPLVKGDSQWLMQVFDNLVSNALKFTSSGGAVTVSLSDRGECVLVSVSDTGIGIEESDQPHVFEKFYRAKNSQVVNTPGTGLGLAICKSIVDLHEGRIWLESKPGSGAKFYFMVPALRGEREPEGFAPQEAEKV